MESRKQETAGTPPIVGGEFRNLKDQGSATLDELREFLATMRGKSPTEMLGALAESGLVRCTVQATLATVVLLGAFTVGPYLLGVGRVNVQAAPAAETRPASAAQPPTASSATAATAAAAQPTSNAAVEAGAAPTAANGVPLSPAELDTAAKKLGIGETKAADPKVNPLDKDLDNLLDKVK